MPTEEALKPSKIGAGSQFGMRVPRRYISGHNEQAKAIYLEDPPLLFRLMGDTEASHAYGITSVPAEMSNDADLQAYLSEDASSPASQYHMSVGVPNGVNIIVLNLAPGASTHMHRSVTLDTTICVEGHVGMETDSGEIREFFPGVSRIVNRQVICSRRSYMLNSTQDQIIQRGTAHRWLNLSRDKPARTIGITINANPITIAGKQLKEDHMYREDKDK
jgi:quercetin dioxygenase-like cupin family protein